MGIAKQVNHSFFDSWSEEMAWVLGFWAADGCVKHSRGTYVISFKQKERYVIERIKTIVGSFHSIVEQKDKHDPRYELSYTSLQTYLRLCDLFKCDVRAKSMTLLFPAIPQEYGRHFIRGCIDGDGSLFWSICNTPRIKFVSGSEAFAKGLYNYASSSTGIIGSIGEEKIWRVEYSGIKAKCLSWWLYHDAKIYLDRKWRLSKEFEKWMPRYFHKTSITTKARTMFPLLLSTSPKVWTENKDVFIMLDNGMSISEKATQLSVSYNAVAKRRWRLRMATHG